MQRSVNTTSLDHFILPAPADATEVELVVMSWFASGHEILWIPIYEIDDEAGGMAQAKLDAAHFGGPRLVRSLLDCYRLPVGIKGWLFPAHLDDTDIICALAAPQDLSFGYLFHNASGKRISWRFNTESEALWPE